MKIYTQENLKRNLLAYLNLGTCLITFVVIGLNIKVVTSSREPVLIAIDQNGTREVSHSNDPIFKTEAIHFISTFLNHIYNFDSTGFMRQMGYATTLMSEDLWKEKKSEILDLKTRVELNEISLVSEIEKITLDENGNYFALLSVKEKSRMNSVTREVKVKLRLKATPRTSENPYGLEVGEYSEEH